MKKGGIDMQSVQLAAMVGSLRKGSFNRGIYNFIQEHLPEGVAISEAPIADLPLYNLDLGFPPAVETLFSVLRPSQGVVICTPEYNYSIPGGLKNAIDWASRDPEKACLTGKPAVILGASSGAYGTVRGQMHLRNSLVFLDMPVIPKPEVMIPNAASKFDADGRLTDSTLHAPIIELINRLVARIRQG